MADLQTAPAQTAISDEAWLRSLRVTTAHTEPARPPLVRRRLAVGALLGLVAALVIVVHMEVLNLPEGAFAGLLLRAQMKMAELMPAASGMVVEVEQRPLSLAGRVGASGHRTRSRRATRGNHGSTRLAIADNSAAVGRLQVLPIRPLQPFNIEVVNGGHRRLLPGRTAAVHVDISGSESLLSTAPAQKFPLPQAGNRAATLLALINAEGRVEDLWVLDGPAPTSAALNLVRRGQYRPFMLNGTPVEMEALIIVDPDSPGLLTSNPRSQ